MNPRLERKLQTRPFLKQTDDELIICRCEEITKGEIRRAVYEGMLTMNEIKRFLRAGMGLCQGQNCNRIVRRIIAAELKTPVSEVALMPPRAPARPIPMNVFANDGMGQISGGGNEKL